MVRLFTRLSLGAIAIVFVGCTVVGGRPAPATVNSPFVASPGPVATSAVTVAGETATAAPASAQPILSITTQAMASPIFSPTPVRPPSTPVPAGSQSATATLATTPLPHNAAVSNLTLSADVKSGSYNSPQTLRFTASPGAIVYYTLDGSEPSAARGIFYQGPVTLSRTVVVKGVAVSGDGRSTVATVAVRILNAPTFIGDGRFEVVDPHPIFQGITRTAFMHSGGSNPKDMAVHFSTLESYHRNTDGDRFLMYRYRIDSGRLDSITIQGSIEARSSAYVPSMDRFVLGASLDPKVLLYNPADQNVQTIFSLPDGGAWIHDIATDGRYAYTVLSASQATGKLARFNGVLKIDLRTGEPDVIPFTDRLPHAWGGVESIDPSGRIWLWRGEPRIGYWYDVATGFRKRAIKGYDGWTVSAWDQWGDRFFVIVTGEGGQSVKVEIKIDTLEPVSASDFARNDTCRLFLTLLPLDPTRRAGPQLEGLYSGPRDGRIFRVAPKDEIIFETGNLKADDFVPLGELLGDRMALWLPGQKSLAVASLVSGDRAVKRINAPHLSPADITGLAAGADGAIYGGGYLTITDMFRFDPATGKTRLLESAIPYGEGQVNSLYAGTDGKIYGGGYPFAVIYQYDPLRAWAPGEWPDANPRNVGKMKGDELTRPFKAVQDRDGAIWHTATGDLYIPVAHGLVRIDFATGIKQVKTDVADGFPVIEDLAVFDDAHLVLLGRQGPKKRLFLLDQRDFRIELAGPDAVCPSYCSLINLTPDHGLDALYLADGDSVYRVLPDLSLARVHQAIAPVLKAVAVPEGGLLLMGLEHIEYTDSGRGIWEVWWDGRDRPERQVLDSPTWLAVAVQRGVVYIGYRQVLRVFHPPTHAD